MASAGGPDHDHLPPSVFLSYASEDRSAARSIRDALVAEGIEVWYDENELGGGDEWDQKIRRQIRECDFFMAVISARTEARREGYFRREWRLAVDRTLDMADGHLFLIPVVIDETSQGSARVPDRFASVQWLKVPNGQPTPGLKALCERLISGDEPVTAPPRLARARKNVPGGRPPPRELPQFPIEEPGQRVKFWVHVIGWAVKSAWIMFQRLARWIRVIVYIWLFIFLISRGCSHDREANKALPPEAAEKLKSLSAGFDGSPGKAADIGKLGVDIARAFADDAVKAAGDGSPLLAVPFNAPAGDAADAKLADSTFTLLFGKLAISQQGRVALSKEPLVALDVSAAAERGRANHSTYVLCGGIENRDGAPALSVDIVEASDGSVVWTKSFAAAGGDPSAIATEVESHLPALEEK
jgi:TolB-like protein